MIANTKTTRHKDVSMEYKEIHENSFPKDHHLIMIIIQPQNESNLI